MHLEFVTYQRMAVTPTRPDSQKIFGRFPEAKRCPPFAPTVAAGLWLYPPFDATVHIEPDGKFIVVADEGLEALSWTHRMEELVSWASTWWCSKIPGVLQIDLGLVILTNPGKQLLLTQPMNYFDRPFIAQTGIIDSDFFHAPFTVNLVPTIGQKQFSLSRSEPIAQLLCPNDVLAPLPFHMSTIEERHETLTFWRSYIGSVYGTPEFSTYKNNDTPRQQSVYREWLAIARRPNHGPSCGERS